MSDCDDLAEIIRQGIHNQEWGLDHHDIAVDVIAAGWRPPARVTTTAAELDNLPGESVVIDSDGSAWRKGSDYRDIPRWWLAGAPGGGVGSSIVINHAPVTVVYTPEES
ncbi:hypothetical protein [Acidipropionibacterium acidipropionici]|uniref:hypothetical protein n=1 Tax=Acidipropionibacterium acidipropionici TaxID=1748 RepID=UPI00110AD58B|nr:hypothetical protein [Acidipropionibacterium acidipropionici]QCV95657.1 hypothetical protein FEZ30_10685 [Acidipropionibacterium acidipropionici]